VLVVTGDRGMDYWKDMMPLEGKDAYYNQELDRRTALFPRGERVVIADAGHMLHYDQPRAVGEAVLAFINQ
jgi:pimeloyl-ACP methyl ester carboxylesterase